MIKAIFTLVATLAALLIPSVAPAQLAAKPVVLIVPFAAGGNLDLIARIIAPALMQHLGRTVVVQNKVGAGGVIGTTEVARAEPDGSTLLVTTPNAIVVTPRMMTTTYSLNSFTSAGIISSTSLALVVRADNKRFGNFADLMAYAKANPGKLNYASGGSGTATHLAGELFNAVAGTDLVHVPYKGSAPAMTDLISGQAAAMFDQISTALPQVRNGTVRAMGVTTKERSPVAPDIPSLAEGGLTGYDMSTWHGLVAPAGTPVAIINYLHDQTVKALESPEVRKSFADAGIVPVSSTPAELEKFTADEIVRWREVIRKAGIEPVQ